MKNILSIISLILIATLQTFAQKAAVPDGIRKSDLPVVYMPDNLSVHFVSPEPIQYVDISSNAISGDLPLKNILRIKYRSDSAANKDAVVTIVGEKFIAQYHVVYSPDPLGGAIESQINITPSAMQPVDIGTSLSVPELKNYAMELLYKRPQRLQHSKAFGIEAQLDHIYTLGDYVFIDVSYKNHTRLGYDIDDLRFRIEDKKVTKATTVQSIAIRPEFTLFDQQHFKKHYRNIFVFKKFTFPNHKVLRIEMSEKQISGRMITLEIPYKDVLEADIVN
jgi:conjugative transposon TraN protein